INQVEVEALHQGNSLSAHQFAQTPIESFSGLTFPVNPAVEARVQQEVRSVHLDIPLISNATVSGIIAYFQAHARGYITHVLEGLDEYGPMISAALKKEGLPHDLLYLPGPESAFNPHATSRKGAKGIWQLMRGTAALHGLKDNMWIDEREDPYRSTQAAAAQLKSLYQQFGDWYLALAAYDTGPGNVQRAIQQTGYADYWKLRSLHALLPETENYVPLFLATALIAKDPGAYGFAPPSAAPLKVDRVQAGGQVDLRLVAGIVGTPVDALVRLNPALKGYETPPADPSFMLNLPAGTKDVYEREIALVPSRDRLWWRAVRMDGGETIASIARKFRISPDAIAAANRITVSDPLPGGDPLLIPLAPTRTEANARFGVRYVRRRYYYRVRRGDNLELIADRFDVSTYQLRRWNHLRSSRLVSGRRLLVYRRVAVRVSPHHRLRRYIPRRIARHAHHHAATRRAANSVASSATR
ncbi:MAG: transglycosylase SLT domain-containing protein, partial [Acidobacteriota bacterium]|nr:transglycosylase SLT domain-containing protein [Acidobacteriota bacterium]